MSDDLLLAFCNLRDDFRLFWSVRNKEGVAINSGLREWITELRRLRNMIHPQMLSIDSRYWER